MTGRLSPPGALGSEPGSPEATPRSEGRFIESPYRWIILACCVLAYATSQLTRWSYTGVAPYISGDLQLDKAGLGLLGAAFFYPYALSQVPWGRVTDRVGGRFVIGLGLIGTGLLFGLFATSDSFSEAVLWRLALGLASACAYVPIAALLAQWFEPRDRGLANGVYYGFGGGLGEAAAFLFLPALGLLLWTQSDSPGLDWRAALWVMGGLVVLIGMACVGVLRSFPSPSHEPDRPGRTVASDLGVAPLSLRDPVLWLLGCYFAAGVIALRLIPGWITIYAAELYRLKWGYGAEKAVIAGGVIGVLYVFGHVGGSPLLGLLSDRWLQRGIGRIGMAAVGLALSAVGFGLLVLPLPSPWVLGGLAVVLGVVLHTFPLVNAAAAEWWGSRRAGESLGWINMVGQFAGAVSLSVSGFVGMAAASPSGGPLSEYVGIWWLGTGSCAVGALAGWAAHRRMRAYLVRYEPMVG